MENTPALQAERIDTLVHTYGNMLFRFCLMILGSTGDAEDAVQETFISCLKRQPVFNDSEHEKAWLLKTASNKCRDILRWRSRHAYTDIDEIAGYIRDTNADRPPDTGILEALMTLPEKYRSVLILHYVEEYSTQQISRIIGRTPSAVKMRLKKGRELLKEAYRKEGR